MSIYARVVGRSIDTIATRQGRNLHYLLNVIGVFCKRKEMIRMIQAQKVAEALNLGEIDSGKGLNQELSLPRPGDTRWGYHYKTILNKVKNIHRFRVEMFLSVIDLQIQELNNRFDEVNMELLICMACLNPTNSFAAFDQKKILRLAEFYPQDFTKVDLLELEFQLEMYIDDVRNDARFQQVKDLGGLSCMLVETSKDKTFPYVYLLLKLVLILPVATTSVERVFSGMSFVKSRLRNSMSDQLLNDSLVTFIEKDIFLHVSDESVLRRFQNMKTRRVNF
uniref:HAT C-terminal dimerisation domain-containing protein n=1 Tax=Kalanchoe fedtschenkoi TaxID=63787 RepID=A0A7N0V9M2_KALFE